MKLHLDQSGGAYRVEAYGPGFVTVNEERLTASFVLTPERLIRDWAPRRFDDLDVDSVEVVARLEPAVALLGTGTRQHFPAPELLAPLTSAGVGVEVMTTAAACRTYNILMAEGRRVAAMLMMMER